MSLLKPSGWYLRPPHLTKSFESNALPPSTTVPQRPERPYIPPEEELYIRKCCPITLNHLLPDLYLTRRRRVDESLAEFDTDMVLKFEEHLKDSHSNVSCTNSTENEEEESEEEEKNIETCLENDINLQILQNVKMKLPNKHLLKPHIVNYPEPDMKDLTLPSLALNNNKYCAPPSRQAYPTTLQCAKNVQRYAPEIGNLQDFHDVMIPLKNNRQIQPFHKETDFIHSPMKRGSFISQEKDDDSQHNQFDGLCTEITPKIEIDSRFPDPRFRETPSTNISTHLPLQPQYLPSVAAKSSLCIDHHRRSRSLSPFKTGSMFNVRPPALAESTGNLVFPSPHLIQLARLKQEELKIQEKMILRQRQMLELERLRSPADRWYELKSCKFHQEAHKNTIFLRNESSLPLIRKRREQLCKILMTSNT